MKRFYQSNNSSKTCKNCRIIRTFLLAVLFIVLLGLIKSDQLHYLHIVTPMNAAIFIIIIGSMMFFFKLIKYLIEKNKKIYFLSRTNLTKFGINPGNLPKV